MKRITLFLLSVTLCVPAFAQTPKIDYNKIVRQGSVDNEVERLVQIAWQNQPLSEQYRQQITISKENENLAKKLWMTNFTATSNFNEYSVGLVARRDITGTPYKAVGNEFTPFLNLSLGISLYTPTRIKSLTKIAQAEQKVSEQKINAEKITLRAKVLRAYHNYKNAKEQLALQRELTAEVKSRYDLAKQLFNDGKIKLDEFNKALDFDLNERSKELSARNKFDLAKDDLEELLGVTLEEAQVN